MNESPPSDLRACTCHPDDRPPICQHRYAASECKAAYEWLGQDLWLGAEIKRLTHERDKLIAALHNSTEYAVPEIARLRAALTDALGFIQHSDGGAVIAERIREALR
jgi:hypothetical protein